jgi:hypothetical protein
MSQTTLPPPEAEPTEMSQVQADLLSLLHGTGTTGPASHAPTSPTAPPQPKGDAAENAPAAHAEGCPSCGFTGSWGMNSWCPKCGYFPRFGKQGEVVAAVSPEDELPPTPWELVAGWIWALVGGMAAIIALSAAISFLVQDPAMRGAMAAVQVFVGLMAGVGAQCRAYLLSMLTSENFKIYSIVTSPIAIWRGALKQLPTTKKVFFTAAWGWTAFFAGMVFIGVHWETHLKAFQDYVQEVRVAEAARMANATKGKADDKKGDAPPEPGQMTFGDFVGEVGKTLTPEEQRPKMKFRVADDGGDENVEDALNGLVDNVPADMKETDEEALEKLADVAEQAGQGEEGAEGGDEKDDPKERIPEGQRCLIMGYTANSSGEIRSLLVAVPLKDGRLRFAAKLSLDALTNRDLVELRKVLLKIRTKQPVTTCPFGGVWVAPVLQCRVLNDGWTNDGRLKNPRVEELLIERVQTKPQTASATAREFK